MIIGVSSHDHGNCQLCDYLEARMAALERERDEWKLDAQCETGVIFAVIDAIG